MLGGKWQRISGIGEVCRFCLAGASTFILDYVILYILAEWGKVNYLYAAAISFVVAVVVNYWLCIVFVFKHAQAQNFQQKVLFIGSSVVGLGINQVCMWFLVEFMMLHYMVAKVFSTIAVTVWNYIMKRKAVMGK